MLQIQMHPNLATHNFFNNCRELLIILKKLIAVSKTKRKNGQDFQI